MTTTKKTVAASKPLRKISLDMDGLTLGDLEAFEEAVGGDLMKALTPTLVRDENGRPVPDFKDPKHRPLKEIKVNAKTMVGLVWIALRKDEPELTLAEVKAMPLSSLEFDLEGADASDPTPSPEESEKPSA